MLYSQGSVSDKVYFTNQSMDWLKDQINHTFNSFSLFYDDCPCLETVYQLQ